MLFTASSAVVAPYELFFERSMKDGMRRLRFATRRRGESAVWPLAGHASWSGKPWVIGGSFGVFDATGSKRRQRS